MDKKTTTPDSEKGRYKNRINTILTASRTIKDFPIIPLAGCFGVYSTRSKKFLGRKDSINVGRKLLGTETPVYVTYEEAEIYRAEHIDRTFDHYGE